MVVDVAFAVAEGLHSGGGGVDGVQGGWGGAGGSDQGAGFIQGYVDGVRFGGGGEVEAGLGQSALAFRWTEAFVGGPGGVGLDYSVGVGESDVLVGDAGHAAGDGFGVFATGEHADHPVKCGVGVGRPKAFVEGGKQVVVGIAGLVVGDKAALEETAESRSIERGGVWEGEELFDEVEEVASVAIGHGGDCGACFGLEGEGTAEGGLGADQEGFHGGLIEAV